MGNTKLPAPQDASQATLLKQAVRRMLRSGPRRRGCATVLAANLADLAAPQLAADPFPAEIELSSLLAANGSDGSAGFVLNGVDAYDHAGRSVATAGDVNGDGIGNVCDPDLTCDCSVDFADLAHFKTVLFQ